tara:strand:- start:3108 stop:3497 length:390 start_codon:yes stop_codon:yes gene_type:complete
LFDGENQIGFQCFANYTPKKKGQPWIYHSNRVVIHPDYVGLGLGIKLADTCSALMKTEHPDCRIFARFSSVPMYKHRQNNDNWSLIKVHRIMKQMQSGKLMERKTGFRDKGVTSFSFEYVGQNKEKENG